MARKRTEQEWENHKFPRESALQNYVLKRLRKLPQLRVDKIADRVNAGVSDLLICAEGKYVAIELKVGYNKPSDLQKIFLANVKRAGGIVGVAYTWGEVKSILRNAMDIDKALALYEEERARKKADGKPNI